MGVLTEVGYRPTDVRRLAGMSRLAAAAGRADEAEDYAEAADRLRSAADPDEARAVLEELAARHPEVSPGADDPWRDCGPAD